MPDFPTGIPDIPNAALSDTLFSMHANVGHVPATNRILANLSALASKLGIGSSAPGASPAVLRRSAAGASVWGPAQAADHVGGGTANRLLKTSDGTAVVWDQANGADIGGNTIGPAHIQANSIDTAKIIDAAVTTAKLADLNVTTGKLADLGVTTAKLADANVTTAKLAANAATQVNSAAIGAGDSTTSGTPVDILSTSIALTTVGGPVILTFWTGWTSTVVNSINVFYYKVDTGGAANGPSVTCLVANSGHFTSFSVVITGLAAGAHTFKIQWSTNAGTLATAGVRTLTAMELKR